MTPRPSAPSSATSTISAPEAAPPSDQAIPGIHLQGDFRFRKGQEAFLRKLAEALRRGEENHMGVFVPGYGKTITALASFVVAHHLGAAEKLVVFVPRGNLRDQYADAEELTQTLRHLGAPPFTFCVADGDRVFLKNLDTQIIITTYQYASGEGGHRALLQYCQSAPCLFVFDEVHHLSDDGTWASMIEQLPFACSVALSGTPMRSDNKTLFGVPFELREDGSQYYVALHEVTMRDAHEEGGILKRVQAHVVDYRLKLVRADTGEEVELSLAGLREQAESSKEIDTYLARRKLRFHDVYLETLLEPAFERFTEKRRALRNALVASGRAVRGPFRNHQMLVIAMSNRHAAAILDFIHERFPQFIASRIGQDLPARTCAERLEQYRDGQIDVMVQVDMIGEGTDIKPISVIVKADLVRAYSKTLQQVFRGMRYFREWDEDANMCDIYAANDSEVVDVLEWISAEEQLGVKLKAERKAREAPLPPAPSERSAWELTSVQQGRMRSHALELQRGQAPGSGALQVRSLPERPRAIDLNAREKELRQECAALASELAFMLQADGHNISIRTIHSEAKRRLSKAQHQLSVQELEQKQRWLERCLRSRRLV